MIITLSFKCESCRYLRITPTRMLILNLYWIIILKLRLPPTFTGVLWENMVPTLFPKDNMYVIFKDCILIKISVIESSFNVNCHFKQTIYP